MPQPDDNLVNQLTGVQHASFDILRQGRLLTTYAIPQIAGAVELCQHLELLHHEAGRAHLSLANRLLPASSQVYVRGLRTVRGFKQQLHCYQVREWTLRGSTPVTTLANTSTYGLVRSVPLGQLLSIATSATEQLLFPTYVPVEAR